MALPFSDVMLDDPMPLDKINGNINYLDAQKEAFANTSLQQIYVSKTGNDTTGDGTSSKPYLTIAKAVSMIMSNYRPKEIIIDGDYSDEYVDIKNISIPYVGITGTSDAKIKSVNIANSSSTHFRIAQLTFTSGAASYGSALRLATHGAFTEIYNCIFTSATYGIFAQAYENVIVSNCTFNNNTYVLQCEGPSKVIFINNTGSGNTTLFKVILNGYLKKIGTLPSYTNSEGFTASGGIIDNTSYLSGTAIGQGASLTGIADVNGYYTSGNVEGALQELGERYRYFYLPSLSSGSSFILPNLASGNEAVKDIFKAHNVSVVASTTNFVYQKTLSIMASWQSYYSSISTLNYTFTGATENDLTFEFSRTANYITDFKITNNTSKDLAVHVYDTRIN